MLPDCDGNDIVVGSASAQVHVSADQTAPTIESISFAGGASLMVTVKYDELLDPVTSVVKGNYDFGAGKTVDSATLSADGKTVVLAVTGLGQNANYSLTVSGVKDLALNTIATTTLTGTVPFYEINVALGGGETATQSTTAYNGVPERAIDGNTNGDWGASSTTHTSDAGGGELNPWWEVDLGKDETIGRLVYWPRTDCCTDRNLNLRLTVMDASRNVLWSGLGGKNNTLVQAWNVYDDNSPSVVGQIIRVERELTAKNVMSIAELVAVAPYQNVTITVTQDLTPEVEALESSTATFGPVAATISGAPADKLSIQWQKNGVDIPGANGPTYTTSLITLPGDQNAKFVARFLASGIEARTIQSNLKVLKDDIRPTVVSLAGYAGQTIAVCFNELMGADTGDKFNYSAVDGNNLPIGLNEDGRLGADGKTVVFRVAMSGNTFKLTIKHAYDLAGNDINPPGQVTVKDGIVDYGLTPTDIGSPTIQGDVSSCAPGKLSIYAGGNPRNNTEDQLTFACEEIKGDFDKVVKVTGASGGRGGIMARDVLDPSSRLVQAEVEGDLVSLWARIVLLININPANYDRQSAVGGVNATLPDQWIRLKRTGNSFHVFVRDANHPWAQFASKHSVDMPETLCVGLYAASNVDGEAVNFDFQGYGDYVPANDTTKPKLVSAGTLDKATIGLKFSEQIKGSSVDPAKFSVTSGAAEIVTVVSAKTGIQGDSVYLEVTGLTSDNFTVKASGVTDLAGNEMVANSTVAGQYSGWKAVDIGFGPGYVDPTLRPAQGDNPYIVGKSVVLGSGDQVEIDYVGGGYNNFRGDLNHFVYKEIEGDFDYKVENTRYDRSDATACCSNGGLMVRDALYQGDPPDFSNQDVTRVARLSAATYSMANDTKLLFSYRDASGSGIGQGNDATQGFGTADPDGFIGKWAKYKNTINSNGEQRPNTSPAQNLWFRVQRQGQTFTVYWSHFGTKWTRFGSRVMANIGATTLVGWAIMTDSAGEGSQDANHYVTANLRHFGPTLPDLTIVQQPGSVVISWNASRGAGFTLKMSNDVAGPWENVNAQVTTVDGVSSVTLQPLNAKTFFQLVK